MRLDLENKALATQCCRYIPQKESESVVDFTRCLERTFGIAYGRDALSADTRDTLLRGQLQDGLKYELMKALPRHTKACAWRPGMKKNDS